MSDGVHHPHALGFFGSKDSMRLESSDLLRGQVSSIGNYIDKDNALKIGLLPAVDPEKVHFVGNAAAAGAEMILINNDSRQNAKKLAADIEYIEIALEQQFTSVYADSMFF